MKLTKQNVLDIFSQRPEVNDHDSNALTSRELALKYGISERTVRDIWSLRSRRNLTRSVWTVEESQSDNKKRKMGRPPGARDTVPRQLPARVRRHNNSGNTSDVDSQCTTLDHDTKSGEGSPSPASTSDTKSFRKEAPNEYGSPQANLWNSAAYPASTVYQDQSKMVLSNATLSDQRNMITNQVLDALKGATMFNNASFAGLQGNSPSACSGVGNSSLTRDALAAHGSALALLSSSQQFGTVGNFNFGVKQETAVKPEEASNNKPFFTAPVPIVPASTTPQIDPSFWSRIPSNQGNDASSLSSSFSSTSTASTVQGHPLCSNSVPQLPALPSSGNLQFNTSTPSNTGYTGASVGLNGALPSFSNSSLNTNSRNSNTNSGVNWASGLTNMKWFGNTSQLQTDASHQAATPGSQPGSGSFQTGIQINQNCSTPLNQQFPQPLKWF